MYMINKKKNKNKNKNPKKPTRLSNTNSTNNREYYIRLERWEALVTIHCV